SANGQTKTDSCLHKEYQLFLLCSCFRLTYSVPVNSNTDKVTTNAHSQGKRFLAEKICKLSFRKSSTMKLDPEEIKAREARTDVELIPGLLEQQ
ncbi:hypothetical protein SDJN02_11023, partial [Cucurbita argyrosperma subsp. argyrosperma]